MQTTEILSSNFVMPHEFVTFDGRKQDRMNRKERLKTAVQVDPSLPPLEDYIARKTTKNILGGRPHFVAELAKTNDPKEQLLNIFEAVWIKNRPIGNVARQYKTGYLTIARILQDCEPFKNAIITYLQITPRAKRFYNRETDTSDFETIQNYIRRAHRDGTRRYAQQIKNAERCYRFLKYRDPANWTAEDILGFLNTLTPTAASNMLDCLRQVAPQLREKGGEHEISVARFREKIRRRKKDIFGEEVQLIRKAIKAKLPEFAFDIFDLHISIGAREGSHGVDVKSGLAGLTWDRFKKNFSTVDLYESKVRGGIYWRDCPLNIFFKDLPDRLCKLWIERGKPIMDRVIVGGYDEVRDTWKQINQAVAEYYEGKLEPSLFKELTTLRPHDADKIHVNLLWEAGVPLEVVAGQYIGQGEGIGLMGRGWLNIDTIKKHYLSLTTRSERFKKLQAEVSTYAQKFNGRNEAYYDYTRYS